MTTIEPAPCQPCQKSVRLVLDMLDFENGAVGHDIELPQIPKLRLRLLFGNPYSSSYLSSLSLSLFDCMFAFHFLESQCVKSS
jgi:hypothetical protein